MTFYVKVLLISCLSGSACRAWAQTDPSICDSSSYLVKQYLRNDAVTIPCDTMFLMNSKTFHLLHRSYLDYQIQSESVAGLFHVTDAYLEAYKNRVEEQRREFDSLRTYFTSLADSSRNLVHATQQGLHGIDIQLDSISLELDIARGNISEAIDIVKKEERKRWITNVLWGAGGLAVGVWLTVLAVD